MSAKVPAHSAAKWLHGLLFLGLATAGAIQADATAAKKSAPLTKFSAVNAISTQAALHIQRSAIDGEMLKQSGRASQDTLRDNIQLAAIDPASTRAVSPLGGSGEPFGLFGFVAPDSITWVKWHKVADDIRAENPALMRCLADESTCSVAAARFAAIVNEARGYEGRVRLNFVNQRVNNAIRYTSDMTQWGKPDEWSAPLANGKGSFETGLGDCEDYAIAKYVALRAAGVTAKQLRVLLVHDNVVRLEHAVLAANEDGHWYVLDNRWTAAIEDVDVRRFTPLFALDDEGVKLLVRAYASDGFQGQSLEKTIENVFTTLGLRPSIL